jgi:hypothetical protein
MTPKVCGLCKHFGAPYKPSIYDSEGEEVDAPTYHSCDLLPHLNESSSKNWLTYKLWPLAGVTDGSGYHAALKVQHDFGCNQWASPEPQAKQDE